MKIQSINSYTQSNNTNFKERDVVDDYIKTPYEQEMDWLYKETENQIKLMKYFHKDNPKEMQKAINEIYKIAEEKSATIKKKYLKPKSFIKNIFKY